MTIPTIDPSGTRGFTYDPILSALVSIDETHHIIHLEKHFTASDYDGALLSGVSKEWLLKTGSIEPHTIFELNASNGGLLEIFEGTAVSANGSSVSTFNNRRSSIGVSLATFFADPTVTTAGTKILSVSAGNDSAPVKINSILDRSNEMILKPSINYLFRYTPNSNQRASLELNFYEV